MTKERNDVTAHLLLCRDDGNGEIIFEVKPRLTFSQVTEVERRARDENSRFLLRAQEPNRGKQQLVLELPASLKFTFKQLQELADRLFDGYRVKHERHTMACASLVQVPFMLVGILPLSSFMNGHMNPN